MVLVCQWIVNEKMLACKLCLIYFLKSSLASSCRSKRCLNGFSVHHNYEKEVNASSRSVMLVTVWGDTKGEDERLFFFLYVLGSGMT